jgi:hypothetical protein
MIYYIKCELKFGCAYIGGHDIAKKKALNRQASDKL